MGAKFLMQKIFMNSRRNIGRSLKRARQRARRLGLFSLMAFSMICSSTYCPGLNAEAFTSQPGRNCDDVQFIFARGSGESLDAGSKRAWQKALEDKLRLSSLKYSFYELGSKSWSGNQYPAVSVGGSLAGGLNLVGAYIGGGKAFQYGASVKTGMAELKAYLDHVSKTCPETKFVLGGYSQGGQVISSTMPKLSAEKVIYAATFGDPKLYLPEGSGLIPPACRGKNYSNYRLYVPNCRAHEGILDGTNPYQMPQYIDKLGVWCNKDDIMCSGAANLNAHTAYVRNGLYDAAAKVITEKLIRAFPEMQIHTWWSPTGQLQNDVAFLIDTTGSMKKVMDKYSSEAKKLAKNILDRGGRIALFEYQDLRDRFKPRKVCDFGCDFEEFSTKLDNLKTGDGGDIKESALSAMKYTMNSLNWQTGATKSLILLTDADYHNPDRDGTLVDDVVALSLAIDPVNFYVITEPTVMPKYQTLAKLTGGQVFDVNSGTDLTLSSNLVLNRPWVSLPLTEYAGLINEEFKFEATAFDNEGKSEGLTYDWDLDGDGEFELKGAGSVVSHRYKGAFSDFIQVKVTDKNGLSSTMSAYVEAYETPPEPAVITKFEATPIEQNKTTLKFETNAEKVLIIIDDAPYGILEAGRLKVELTNITAESLDVTLVPFNQKDERGKPASLQILRKSENSSGPTSTNQIPLAPNTGVVPAKRTI